MKDKQLEFPMDPFSEYALAGENEHYAKTDFTQLGFEGKIDPMAFSEAFSESIADIPIFNSHLYEKRKGLFYQPYWKYNHEITNRLNIVDCRPMVKTPFEPMEFSTDYYRMRTRRRFDLSREFPVDCSLLRVSDDAYIFSILYHHSAMDPNRGFKLLTKMLSGYHGKIKGKPPKWADSVGMAALKRGQALIKPMPALEFAKEQMMDIWITNRSSLVSNVATEGIRDYKQVKGRHSIRAVIDDPKILKGIFARVKRNNATLNDLVFAVARKTLTTWNEEHGESADRFRFMLITSLKGRAQLVKTAGAGLSTLNFVAVNNGHQDLDTLIQHFSQDRQNQLNKGVDIRFYNLTCNIIKALRVLPMATRVKIAGNIGQTVPCTFYISNLGVVWPEIKDGKPTANSAVLGAGDFCINDFHSSASIARTLGLGLTIRTHNRRLYLNFVADRFRFRYHEMKTLVDRMVENLINTA